MRIEQAVRRTSLIMQEHVQRSNNNYNNNIIVNIKKRLIEKENERIVHTLLWYMMSL